MKQSEEDIKKILSVYGIDFYSSCREIDSSRDAEDVRLNYIIDKKYVLRYNTSDVMGEGRIREINDLVKRYLAEGVKCPKYIPTLSGDFVLRRGRFYCYLSEYLDYALASEAELPDGGAWYDEVLDFTAAFAQKYKNIGISDTMSMYSLFELCPYDKKAGIDEKQDNLNELLDSIRAAGGQVLAEKLADKNSAVRGELLGFYAGLPRCVFQGDENFSNVLVDGSGHFTGLIDFNMSGTDVIVNYLSNMVGFEVEEEDFLHQKPEAVLERLVAGHKEKMRHLFEKYHADETERRAAALYAYIVLICAFPNTESYRYCLKQDATKEKMYRFLECAAELGIGELYVS